MNPLVCISSDDDEDDREAVIQDKRKLPDFTDTKVNLKKVKMTSDTEDKNNNNSPQERSSKQQPSTKIFQDFVRICKEKNDDTETQNALQNLESRYSKLGKTSTKSEDLKMCFIQNMAKTATASDKKMYTYIQDVNSQIKKILKIEKMNAAKDEEKKETRFQCDLCDCSYSDKGSLTKHVQDSNFCSFSTTLRNNLQQHKKHEHQQQMKCQWLSCDQEFLHLKDLHAHIHEGHKCPHCDDKFHAKQKGQFETHIRSQHTKQRPFKCDFPSCEAAYFNQKQLTTHKKVHNKMYECPWCENKFATITQLNYHLVSHVGGREIFCEYWDCQKTFSSKGHMERHVASSHSEDKQYKCDVELCNKMFKYQDSLAMHKRIHDPRNFLKCPWEDCSKKYIKKYYLELHLKAHFQIRDQICDKCGQGFWYKSALKSHMQIHEVDCTEYKCTLCEYSCKAKKNLKHHDLKHHTKEDEE